jgi:hypothetical protein
MIVINAPDIIVFVSRRFGAAPRIGTTLALLRENGLIACPINSIVNKSSVVKHPDASSLPGRTTPFRPSGFSLTLSFLIYRRSALVAFFSRLTDVDIGELSSTGRAFGQTNIIGIKLLF